MDLRRLSPPLSLQLKIKCPARRPSSLSLDVRERGHGSSIEAREFRMKMNGHIVTGCCKGSLEGVFPATLLYIYICVWLLAMGVVSNV